jgi:hypothetical protein
MLYVGCISFGQLRVEEFFFLVGSQNYSVTPFWELQTNRKQQKVPPFQRTPSAVLRHLSAKVAIWWLCIIGDTGVRQ